MGLVLASTPITWSAAEPNKDRCRTAVAMALDSPRRQPNGTPPDEERRKQLLAELERLMESNCRQGIDECRTWQKIIGWAARQ